MILSDDILYAGGASDWLHHGFPYVASNHWGLRHPFVIPLTLSFLLFGENELSLVLVTTSYFFALMILTYLFIGHYFNKQSGFLTSILLLCTPLFAVGATMAGADITELFFVVLSLWIFYRASENPPKPTLFFLAGIAMGLAWWTRETSLGVLILFFLLFLVAHRTPRRYYWIMASGFALMALAEFYYYWTLTGDPLYRIWVDMDQGHTLTVLRSATHITSTPSTGNIQTGHWFDPLLVLLINQEFGLLFYLTLPASYWAWKGSGLNDTQKSLVRVMTVLMVVWFISMAYLIPGRNLPRYFSVSAYAAVVLIALWLNHIAQQSRIKMGFLILILVGSNFALVYLENKIPIFGDRTFIAMAQHSKETLYTDPMTYDRSKFLRIGKQMDDRISKLKVPPNGLYFYNPNRVLKIEDPLIKKQFIPQPEWTEKVHIKPERMWLGVVLEWLKINPYLPEKVLRRLNYPVLGVGLYRVHQN